MTLPTQARNATSLSSLKTIDAYLAALRKQLWELTPEDANDIVEEIRMHILDKTEDKTGDKTGDETASDTPPETFSATIAALGTPAELANKYCTEEMLARGRAARSPAYMARSVGRWALLTLVGVAVFSVSVVGYCLGGFLFMLGMLKLLHPFLTGVYGAWSEQNSYFSSSFRWQSGGPNTPDELLGWWLLPIGLIVGGGLLLLTFRFDNWSIRKFWRPRKWQEF